jgi:hypothetical protein
MPDTFFDIRLCRFVMAPSLAGAAQRRHEAWYLEIVSRPIG